MGGKEYAVKRYGMAAFWRKYLERRKPRRFVDAMTGSGAVAAFVASLGLGIEVVANDAHPAMPTLLRAISGRDSRWPSGWLPPTELTEDEYEQIKVDALTSSKLCPACSAADLVCEGVIGNYLPRHTCLASQDPRVGFAGFGVSFGGKYFAGYGGRPRPSYMRPVEGVAKILRAAAPNLAGVTFHIGDYRTLRDRIGMREGDLWYFDKPYRGTQQYKGVPGNGCKCGECPPAKGGPVFCDTVFWAQMFGLHVPEFGHANSPDILVSEFVAPAPWVPVWSVTRRQEMRDGQNAQTQEGVADTVFCMPSVLAALGGAL